MHSGNDGADSRMRIEVAVEHGAEPLELRVGEFVVAGIVEGDEVHAVAGPVIPGFNRLGVIAVGLALRQNLRPREESTELADVALAGHGKDGLVVSAAEEDWKRSERRSLVGEEVVPGLTLVFQLGDRGSG